MKSFLSCSKPSAAIAQLGLKKVGSSWGSSYHNALHPWRLHHAVIQSTHGGQAGEGSSPAPRLGVQQPRFSSSRQNSEFPS